ncbi:uncharacterized protein LOC117146071 [Drosophila mauritiana]|uniref:Uncharacterized protein LOC117146071 n=1 Tax=Drosophila mauritiana TaxID=7226 RepID=A0A6P8KXD0_DROMA|nr:uncharacterized protein LOC117146071 [Drosophila mauritiana]XP_033167917.1 uncharacterized protein LOC117146071 [Drosophila mauritiana]XP_033167926.1 uncharacterized protein LOC117146071 [Drosophila mauritiana]
MCFNVLGVSNLLPDCSIENQAHLYSLLQQLLNQDRRPEEVSDELRDRYNVFRQVLANYPAPEQPDDDLLIYVDELFLDQPIGSTFTDIESSGGETCESSLDSDSGQIGIGMDRHH